MICSICGNTKNVKIFANLKSYCSKECYRQQLNLGIKFNVK